MMHILAEIQGRALDELRRRGFLVEDVVADGRIHRCPTSDHPSDTPGWYVLHADEWPTLVCGKWHEGEEQATIKLWSDADRPLSLEERHAMEDTMKRRKEVREAERRRAQDEAADKARSDLAKASTASASHPYCLRKGVLPTLGLKTMRCRHPKKPADAPEEDVLLVPLLNVKGVVCSYQRIYADGYKAHMYGAQKKGLFYEIPGRGENAAFLIVCEGWATAATVSRASHGATVMSVGDCGNIHPVLAELKLAGQLHPSQTLIVADNDWETARRLYLDARGRGVKDKNEADYNPGAQAASKAAEAFGCRWILAVQDEAVYPTGETATDANDLYLAKRQDCLQANMAPEEADSLALKTVRSMLNKGWGWKDIAESPKPPMQFISFGEATKLKIQPELIQCFVPIMGIGYLFGPTGVFKTFVAMQLGFHVSEGLSIAGYKVKRRPVYYLLLEGASGLSKRTKALDLWRIQEGIDVSGNYFFWPNSFNIKDPDNVKDLIDTILMNNHEGALVIIDTQSQATPGVDEDKGAEIKEVISNASLISKKIKGVVMFIAHTGKNEEKGLAGSYKQKADVDFHLEIKKPKGSEIVTLKPSKTKENSDENEINFAIRIQEVGTNEDGDYVTSCVLVPQDGVKSKSKPILPSAKAKVMNALVETLRAKRTNKATKKEWWATYEPTSTGKNDKSRHSMLDTGIRELVKAGLVEFDGEYYWPVEDDGDDE